MIHPRSTIGTPTPPADRRRLARVGVLLAHHVGVNVGHRYRSPDPQQVLSDARAVAAFGISSGRPWEYSYMIGLDGSIFEQAGEVMAAHCLGFNPHSAAVVFLNANDVQVNAAQVAAWWEVRDHMVDQDTLAADHVAAPHYRYRKTACPGIRAEAPGRAWSSPTGQGRLGDLIPALTLRPTPPPTTQTGGPAMPVTLRYIATPPPEGAGPNPPWLLRWDGTWSYLTSADHRIVSAAGIATEPLNLDQYVWARRSAGLG